MMLMHTYPGPLLAQVYRCYSTCGFLEANKENFEIWSKKSYFSTLTNNKHLWIWHPNEGSA